MLFDFYGTGDPIQISWTSLGSKNAFLALDRNGNGQIDNGKELFGNLTSQPQTPSPNGFLALGEFDKPENGGNGDGVIDQNDSVFSRLVLWIDENHDGVSQPNELSALTTVGVYSLSTSYKETRKTDQYGNQFRYTSRVNPNRPANQEDVNRQDYDVGLVVVVPR